MTREEHLLTIAAEECAEIAQRISKALRFGLCEVQPGQPLQNAERIRQEYADLVAVLGMLEDETGFVLTYASSEEVHRKIAKVEEFLELSDREGRLVA